MIVKRRGTGLSISRQGGMNEELKTGFETRRLADGDPSDDSPGVSKHYPQSAGTRPGVLALIALLPSFGLAAFDDLVAVTVGTQHGYEYHVALLLKQSAAWHTWR
jgi:hypothetical protein